MSSGTYFSSEEKSIIEPFLEQGHYTFPLAQESKLKEIRSEIFNLAKSKLGLAHSVTEKDFFDNTQKYLSVEKLNELRVFLIKEMNSIPGFHQDLYQLGKSKIDTIVGNELCMQRAANLSIQLPNDTSSLLPLHTDVWSGNSPYEIVFWIPLVDCFKTKSMYLLPYKENQNIINNFSEYSHLDAEELYQALEPKVERLNVPFGHGVIFSHSLLHGNRVNQESTTRWTFNIRFKSALSPYGTKEIGETFLPINIRPTTRIGYNYVKPIVV